MIKKKIKAAYERLRFSLSSSNSFIYNGIHRYFYFPDSDSISYVLNDYSRKRGPGFKVIQVGANDGLINDPINKFIKRDKWQGVLLEPQSWVFENYLQKVYRLDKGIVTLNAALGDKDGTTWLYKIAFSNERWAHGLASFNKSLLEKSLKSGYARRKATKEGIDIPEDPDKQIRREEVKVISPASLLKEYKIDKIDLLQIDTEGFDFEVIKMFEIEKTKPHFISFESLHFSEEDKKACMEYLGARGYRYRTIGANTLAMLDSEKDYRDFFKSL